MVTYKINGIDTIEEYYSEFGGIDSPLTVIHLENSDKKTCTTTGLICKNILGKKAKIEGNTLIVYDRQGDLIDKLMISSIYTW